MDSWQCLLARCACCSSLLGALTWTASLALALSLSALSTLAALTTAATAALATLATRRAPRSTAGSAFAGVNLRTRFEPMQGSGIEQPVRR